jgi:hypothetical protein
MLFKGITVLNIKKVISLLILSVAILSGCGGGGGGGGDGDRDGGPVGPVGTKAKWTYMVYLGADSNLSTSGLGDLNEVEEVGSNNDLNVVVQAEFSNENTNFSEFGFPNYAGETLRFRVLQDNDSDHVNLSAGTSIGNVDMGSPATLTSFIQWAAANYPAEHYALVIWDHGSGWKKANILTKGAVQDTTSQSFMSLPDLARAVTDSGVAMDLINFDACLMAMYEVMYEFSGLTDYMVFSEETEPGNGDPYDTILAALKADPQMTGATLSSLIVDKYIAFYESNGRDNEVTKSAVDMSQIATLHSQVTGLADSIITNYTTESGVIETAQKNSQRYEFPTNLDLYDFASRLANGSMNQDIQTKARAVMEAVTSSVIANKSMNAGVANSHGLAIYLPSANQVSGDQAINDLRDYAALASNTNRASSWLNVVEKTTTYNSETTLVAGGFSIHIAWNTDADADLYVCEPDNICYSPWSGQATPNGSFSGDSYDTGSTEEYYTANDYVTSGQYTIFIQYHSNGVQYSYADITFSISDPVSTNGEWQSSGPINLDLSNPGDFSAIPTYEQLNNYSNFWYPGQVGRANAQAGTATINTGPREINIVVKKEKKVRHEAKK